MTTLTPPGTPPAPRTAATWREASYSAVEIGDLVAHGGPRRVVGISRVQDVGGLELMRLDLDSGEQLHRYGSDKVVTHRVTMAPYSRRLRGNTSWFTR